MAYSSLDPTTGAPVFLDSDAPDPAVNPSQVAAYAGQVGTRLIGTTAQRVAYGYAREGLRWYDTTAHQEYVHNGSGWEYVGETVFSAPSAVMAGSVPPVGALVIRQSGLVAVTTNASGDVGFNYPTPFPNGVISAKVQRHNCGVFGPTFEVLYGTQTLVSLTWRIFNSNGTTAGPGGTFGYTYEAIGW